MERMPGNCYASNRKRIKIGKEDFVVEGLNEKGLGISGTLLNLIEVHQNAKGCWVRQEFFSSFLIIHV